MHFAKKHKKKGLKKMQTNYAKSNAPAEAIKDSVKPRLPQRPTTNSAF